MKSLVEVVAAQRRAAEMEAFISPKFVEVSDVEMLERELIDLRKERQAIAMRINRASRRLQELKK